MLYPIHNVDCRNGMNRYAADTFDIVVTSPPYKDEDGFSEQLISHTFTQVERLLKPNSLLFLNFGHLASEKFRPFKTCELVMNCGFELNDTIVWKKTQFSPCQGKKRLNNLTEFVFLLYKGKMPDLNRLSIGIPYKDKGNVGRYSAVDLRCGGNFWEIGYETIQKKSQKLHNDRMPLELALNCVKLSGLKTGTLLDPFAGSGTSGVAAKMCGLDFVGFDVNAEHCETARKRIEAT